ncbi:hypothetical protein [Spirochaeta isovalerica]|uniref:3-keto-disaccharide hydrolase domain-containing protein n=1 Tax=Spirochaeta isovalerica TaxID=150 RepID=A0A841RDI1_9SPIO|nr:hypothetical protein [Spirochaeta isovalerica]MBB6480909.1 hypothetical protein [Spirochaeta isovalerica]
MKRILPFLILTVTVSFFTACPSPTGNSTYEPPEPELPEFVEENTLFELNDSVRLFSTNVFEFGAGNGTTYWIEEEIPVPVFSDFAVRLTKNSGHSLGGYGVFFAQRNSGTADFSALAVFINTVGEFCVGLIEQGTFSYIKEWTDSDSLSYGYSLNNILSVEAIDTGEYRIIINGEEVYSFEDSSEEAHTGGGFGYLAVVSPLENFPSVPVKIEFEKQ